MKIIELFEEEDVLGDLAFHMLLRSTESKISKQQADEVAEWLKNRGLKVIEVSGEDTMKIKGTGKRHLKISSTGWKSNWNTIKGGAERWYAEDFLRNHGFRVGRWDSHVKDGKDALEYNPHQQGRGPHVYFW